MALPSSIMQRGLRSAQPAATAVAAGTIYCVTDEGFIQEQSNGTTWSAYSPSTGTGTVTTSGSPASGNLTKFSGATAITNGDLSGDVTTSGTLATTIANNAVTTAKINANAVTLAKLATQTDQTILGNVSGGVAVPVALTATQVSTMLNSSGSWTPGIAFGAASVGVTYSLQVGRYVRNGNVVIASGHFILTSKGSSTGNVTITGLPFTTKNITNYSQAGSLGLAFGTTETLQVFADPNTTVLRVWRAGANGNATDAQISGTGEFLISICYESEP